MDATQTQLNFKHREQGLRHEVLIGRGGFIGTQTHLLQKFTFSSDLRHFILKMLENAKF